MEFSCNDVGLDGVKGVLPKKKLQVAHLYDIKHENRRQELLLASYLDFEKRQCILFLIHPIGVLDEKLPLYANTIRLAGFECPDFVRRINLRFVDVPILCLLWIGAL